MELVVERERNHPDEREDESSFEQGEELSLEQEPVPKRLWMLEDEALARARLFEFILEEIFKKNTSRSGSLFWRYFSNTKRVLNVVNGEGQSIAYKGYLTPTMNTMYDMVLDAMRGKSSFREALIYVSNLGRVAEKRHRDTPFIARKNFYTTASKLNLIEDEPVLEGESLFEEQCKKIADTITTSHWEVHRWVGQKQPSQEDNKRRITDTMALMLEEIRQSQTVPALERQTWERTYFNIIKLAKTAAIKHKDMDKPQSRFYKELAINVLKGDEEAKAEIDKIVTKWEKIPEASRKNATYGMDMISLRENANRGAVSQTEALDKIMRLGHQALVPCGFFSTKNPPELDKFYQEVADVPISLKG